MCSVIAISSNTYVQRVAKFLYDLLGLLLMKANSALCIVLSVSTACLPLQTLAAHTLHNAIAYNETGDITADNQSSLYRYNPLNQLIYDQTIKSSKAISYQYYATGLQASESVGTNIPIAHYYAGQRQLLDSLQGSDFAGYLRAQGLTLRTYQSQGGIQAQLFVRNRHDSVLTTISGTSAHSQQYNAYGHPLMAATSTPGIARDPLAYSSYFYDQSAGLYYLKARLYSPLYRIFLTRDSKDLNNRYFYVNDNPAKFIDPTGHMSKPLKYSLIFIVPPIFIGGFFVIKTAFKKPKISVPLKTAYAGSSSFTRIKNGIPYTDYWVDFDGTLAITNKGTLQSLLRRYPDYDFKKLNGWTQFQCQDGENYYLNTELISQLNAVRQQGARIHIITKGRWSKKTVQGYLRSGEANKDLLEKGNFINRQNLRESTKAGCIRRKLGAARRYKPLLIDDDMSNRPHKMEGYGDIDFYNPVTSRSFAPLPL